MTVWRCKDQVKSFNKRSAEMKSKAVEFGMDVHTEWKDGDYECFMARMPQATLKQGLGVYAECGANVGGNPYVWWTVPGGGMVYDDTYIQK